MLQMVIKFQSSHPHNPESRTEKLGVQKGTCPSYSRSFPRTISTYMLLAIVIGSDGYTWPQGKEGCDLLSGNIAVLSKVRVLLRKKGKIVIGRALNSLCHTDGSSETSELIGGHQPLTSSPGLSESQMFLWREGVTVVSDE